MLSMTSDYAAGTGCPEPYLRRIADAGFTHVHWCHQWCTDFLYSKHEIDQIERWLEELGLRVLDLHGSAGAEKAWGSAREYERQAGVELVENRIEMTARLGADVVIMHIPTEPEGNRENAAYWTRLRKTFDELRPSATSRGVRIAAENMSVSNFHTIRKLFELYPPDYLGLCYDSGHGNVAGDGLDQLDALKDRLISVHLHDNDGKRDQHKPIFSGAIDWPRLARLIAQSSYNKCVSMEVAMREAGTDDEAALLAHAFETGTQFAAMIEAERNA